MQTTRFIATCALMLALALALIGMSQAAAPALSSTPLQPIIIIVTATPALALVELPQQVEAQQVEAQQVEAQQVEAQQVEAQQVEAQQVEAQQVEAQQVEAQQVEAQQVEQLADLPTIQCPCGIAPAEPYQPMTARQQAQSRQRTR